MVNNEDIITKIINNAKPLYLSNFEQLYDLTKLPCICNNSSCTKCLAVKTLEKYIHLIDETSKDLNTIKNQNNDNLLKFISKLTSAKTINDIDYIITITFPMYNKQDKIKLLEKILRLTPIHTTYNKDVKESEKLDVDYEFYIGLILDKSVDFMDDIHLPIFENL